MADLSGYQAWPGGSGGQYSAPESGAHVRRPARPDLVTSVLLGMMVLLGVVIVLLLMSHTSTPAAPSTTPTTGIQPSKANNPAADLAARGNLTKALTSSEATYTHGSVFPASPTAFVSAMTPDKLGLTFTTGVVSSANHVSFKISTDRKQLVLVAWSPSRGGTCWATTDDQGASPAAHLGASPSGVSFAAWAATTSQPCEAGAAAANTATTGFWQATSPSAPGKGP
jgi:hypothetical protein